MLYSVTNYQHLREREPISARNVARTAGNDAVINGVSYGVVDTIAAESACSSTINTLFCEHIAKQIFPCYLASLPCSGINRTVSLREVRGSTRISASPPVLSRPMRFLLICREVFVSLLSPVATDFSRRQTRLAFVRNPEWSCFVTIKKFYSGRKEISAAKAFPSFFSVAYMFVHRLIIHDGPHFELDRKVYPA